MAFKTDFSLFDDQGQRKYLNQSERLQFYNCAKQLQTDRKLFCWMMFFTGARISEVTNLHVSSLDFSNKTVIIQTLKRRKKGVYRQLPLPEFLLDELKAYIVNRNKHLEYRKDRLWYFSTRTASRYIKSVMNEAGIIGVKSSALGLRHGFAVQAVTKVPITQVQKWLGHALLQTTAIYVSVSGVEERELAKRMWDFNCTESK